MKRSGEGPAREMGRETLGQTTETSLFKNYHIVIFKDREAGFKNLRLRGWLGILLFLVLAGLTGLNIYLWSYYTKAQTLGFELEEAQKVLRDNESQLLSLAGKLQAMESDLLRVQQFDAKLRVMMNIDKDPQSTETEAEAAGPAGALSNPALLTRHRDLFTRRMHSLVDELADAVFLEEVGQQNLFAFLRDNKDTLLSTPSIWPVKGYLTSGFGYRSSPFTGRGRMHTGLDISNRPGTAVWAPARGTVTFSGRDGAYGICITIDHGNNIITRYAHLQKSLVKEGQYVQRGDVVGALGNTGRSTGPHLHYEVLVGGVHVDPQRYILN